VRPQAPRPDEHESPAVPAPAVHADQADALGEVVVESAPGDVEAVPRVEDSDRVGEVDGDAISARWEA
jgi:hypothetical protein